jgi:hypothetical protein
VLVGLPGLAIAVLIKILVREPPRGLSEPAAVDHTGVSPRATAAPGRPFSIRAELLELRAVARILVLDRPVLHMVLGVTIGAFAAYGFYAFLPPYFSRTFELDYSTIGVVAGLAGGVAVGMGIVAGGFFADFLARHGARWYALVPAFGGIIAIPLYVLALLQSDWKTAGWLLAGAGFFQYVSLGPTFGVVQNMVETHRRATATALLYICLSVFALGGGPLFTGWIIDRCAGIDFRHAHFQTSFAVTCPGGAAPAALGPAAAAACRSTLALATRQGLLATLLFFGWACAHYFFASLGIAKALRRAAGRNRAASGAVSR